MDGLARFERGLKRRGVGRLHADDANLSALALRVQLRRGSYARDQAAAADCDDQGLDVRSSIKHLERDGALTLDHREMVKGSDEDRPGVFDELSRGSERALEVVALESHVCSVVARGL